MWFRDEGRREHRKKEATALCKGGLVEFRVWGWGVAGFVWAWSSSQLRLVG